MTPTVSAMEAARAQFKSWLDGEIVPGFTRRDAFVSRQPMSDATLEVVFAFAFDAWQAALSSFASRPVEAAAVDVECLNCHHTREISENWWLVERRDVSPPQYLVFTGESVPKWTTDAWQAQRFGLRHDAMHEAAVMPHTLGSPDGARYEAIEHGFCGGVPQTRCPYCGRTETTKRARARPVASAGAAEGEAVNELRDALQECVVAIEAYRAWNNSATLQEVAALIPPGRFKLDDTRRTDTQFCEFVTTMIDEAVAKARTLTPKGQR